MNQSGMMADSLMSPQGQTNRDWDGIWNAHVRRSEIGWTIEIEIPFRTLNFNPNADAWGVNFQRTVRRKNEESFWTGWGLNTVSPPRWRRRAAANRRPTPMRTRVSTSSTA